MAVTTGAATATPCTGFWHNTLSGTNPRLSLFICTEYYRLEPHQLALVLSINDYTVHNVCFNKSVSPQGLPSLYLLNKHA